MVSLRGHDTTARTLMHLVANADMLSEGGIATCDSSIGSTLTLAE